MIWKEKYKIGVPLVDAQHEELFSRVTTFVDNLRSDKEWEVKIASVNETLDFMKEYALTHFHDEEAYQEKVGFPQLEQHRKIHSDMADYVEMISERCQKGGYQEIVMQQFAGKLVTWLVNHVVSDDREIADFINRKEIE